MICFLKVAFMQIDHKDLEKLAKEKEEENRIFRKFLKFYDVLSDHELDKLVFKITDKVSFMIECTKCARCCKELRSRIEINWTILLSGR